MQTFGVPLREYSQPSLICTYLLSHLGINSKTFYKNPWCNPTYESIAEVVRSYMAPNELNQDYLPTWFAP